MTRLKSFRQIMEDWSDKLDWKREKRRLAHTSNRLYHGTTNRDYRSIKQKGLLVRGGDHNPSNWHYDISSPVVYLTTHKSDARNWASSPGTRSEKPAVGAMGKGKFPYRLLRVNKKDLTRGITMDQNFSFGRRDSGSREYGGDIPANLVHRVNRHRGRGGWLKF